jgi:hypothetical protein
MEAYSAPVLCIPDGWTQVLQHRLARLASTGNCGAGTLDQYLELYLDSHLFLDEDVIRILTLSHMHASGRRALTALAPYWTNLKCISLDGAGRQALQIMSGLGT